MRRAAIVCPLRTPIGNFGGTLKPLGADALATAIFKAVIERSRIDPAHIEEVIVAQSYMNGEAPCIARYAALAAGLPIELPGYSLDRRCGSGLQALINAAMLIESGHADVVLAAGVESMSNIEYYTTDLRWGARAGTVKMHDRLQRGRERSQPEARFGHISGMPETAENLGREYSIGREEADAFAMASHHRAAAAWAAGRFDDEIVPLEVPQAKGPTIHFARDEGIRAELTMETLAKLKPVLKDGTVTAGNASQQNDAAAACLVVAEDKCAALGLEPIAFLRGWAAAGCHPGTMGIGPVPAVRRLFEKTKLGFDDMDLVELNEAFAVQVLAVLNAWGWNDPARLNVNGSGISLGHPIGATGMRIATTLLHELKRRNGTYGLETMCIGGGQGLAAIFERV